MSEKIVPKYRADTENAENLQYDEKHNRYLQRLKEKRPNIIPLEKYVDTKIKMKHKCLVCNYIWDVTPNSLLSGSTNGLKSCPNCAKLKRTKTENEYINELREVNPNIILVDKYVNSNTKIKHKCLICQFIWEALPSNILKGHGCPNCAGNFKKTHLDFKEELANINENIDLLTEYTGANNPITCKCKICNYEWVINHSHILTCQKTGCPKCSGHIVTKQDFNERFSKNGNKNVILLSEYEKSTKKIKCKCRVCGFEYEAFPYQLYAGVGCRKCADKTNRELFIKDGKQFVFELNKIDNTIEITSKYINAHNPISCKCKKCNTEWVAKYADALLRGCYKCPNCRDLITSHGEKNIKFFLMQYNIPFFQQYTYENLRGCENGKLSYDFYLPTYNLLIEFQGEQHERPVEYFGGEEQFKIQQEHDKRKREYAQNNNIKLLEIWYYDIDNIESILIENLKLESVETAG